MGTMDKESLTVADWMVCNYQLIWYLAKMNLTLVPSGDLQAL